MRVEMFVAAGVRKPSQLRSSVFSPDQFKRSTWVQDEPERPRLCDFPSQLGVGRWYQSACSSHDELQISGGRQAHNGPRERFIELTHVQPNPYVIVPQLDAIALFIAKHEGVLAPRLPRR